MTQTTTQFNEANTRTYRFHKNLTESDYSFFYNDNTEVYHVEVHGQDLYLFLDGILYGRNTTTFRDDCMLVLRGFHVISDKAPQDVDFHEKTLSLQDFLRNGGYIDYYSYNQDTGTITFADYNVSFSSDAHLYMEFSFHGMELFWNAEHDYITGHHTQGREVYIPNDEDDQLLEEGTLSEDRLRETAIWRKWEGM